MSTKLILFLSATIILFSFILLESVLSQALIVPGGMCKGSVSFSLSPTQVFAGDTVTANVGNLRGSGCIDKRVYIKESGCQGLQYCSCLLNNKEGEYGCICTFRAPSTPYISGKEPSRQSTFTYYACVDLDNDGVYDETLGEQSYMDLLIYSRYAPLSMVTESIIIIVSLGLLLVIIIFVFKMSLKRR